MPTNTPQKELHHMDLQETIVLRIKWERGSHLATNYELVVLQRTTHTSSKRHQWTWWTPPWWCLDWIWWFWNLRWLELIFVDSPRVSRILGVFIEQIGGSGGHRGGHNPPGHALVSCAHLGLPLRYLFGPLDVFWSKKILKKFRCISTPFGIDFRRCKKHAKNSNWHLALCQ